LKERALATLQNQSLPETAKPPAIDQVATRKLAKLEVKTVDAQATETGGIKTLSSEDIKELSKKEIDLSDYQ
jgi:hypothetical protein